MVVREERTGEGGRTRARSNDCRVPLVAVERTLVSARARTRSPPLTRSCQRLCWRGASFPSEDCTRLWRMADWGL